jgi:lyso-ornithine lipid O-acyltransferase
LNAKADAAPSPLGWLRIGLRIAGLVITLIACVPIHTLWRIFTYGSPMPMLWLRMAARLCGARVERRGTALKRDVVFLANHVSWLDIPVLAGASGTAFVAKAEVAQTPVIGWLAGLNRTVYVQREARMDVAGQINAVKEALADNWAVTIFPEGTTTDGRSLLPFKSSMLKILEPPPPGVMVQPVLIDYGAMAEFVGWVGEETGLANALKILSRRGSFKVVLHFLEPFVPADHSGRKAIAAKARAEIEGALLAALGKPLRPFAHDVGPVRYAAKAEPVDPPT